MNGLELSKGYFEEFGLEMLKCDFADVLPLLAAGYTGSGSEHYGFDDEISRDHDFEPGFCVFLPDEDTLDRKTAFRLERAYAKLPKEYRGITRQRISPVGGNRHGVMRTAEYYMSAVGSPDGRLPLSAWLRIPDHALAEALNGEIFFDNYGQVTEIRNRIKNMPEDILLKRLAGNLLVAAQSGQYNLPRSVRRGEYEAAALCCQRFAEAAMKAVFLMNGRYMPYYKWCFRALKQLPQTKELAADISFILTSATADENAAQEKCDAAERTAVILIDMLAERQLTSAVCGDLEKHAYSVNDGIKDANIRNMHILSGV